MARESESARSASRLLTSAPDVAYGVTPETGGWREGCRRAARRRGVAASNSAASSGQCASLQPLVVRHEPATVGAVLRGRVRVTEGAGPDRRPRPT